MIKPLVSSTLTCSHTLIVSPNIQPFKWHEYVVAIGGQVTGTPTLGLFETPGPAYIVAG